MKVEAMREFLKYTIPHYIGSDEDPVHNVQYSSYFKAFLYPRSFPFSRRAFFNSVW